MIATPRAGLWTPRGRQAPSLMLPYGVAGTSPIGVHSRSGSAPTITRAGTRWFQAGSSFVELAANTHCMEQDGAGAQYVSVYGERTNVVTRSSSTTDWTDGVAGARAALTDSGVASPISGVNWLRLAEGDATGIFHAVYRAGAGALSQNQKFTAQALFKNGDRRWAYLRVSSTGVTGAAVVVVDLTDGSVTSAADGTWTVHAASSVSVGGGAYLVWLIASDSSAGPGNVYPFVGLSDNGTLSAATYDSYDGNSAGYPLGVLVAGVQIAIGATAPGPIIETAGAAVTKSAEIFSHPVADLGIPGSVELIARTWDIVPEWNRLWSWYDADAGSVIECYLDADAHVHLYVHDGVGEQADVQVATAINDGAWHPIVASWGPDYVRLRVGDTDAIDTTATMPTLVNLDTFQLGATAGAEQFSGHIRDFRCYKYRRI